MKRRVMRLARAVLLTAAVLTLAAGLAGVLPQWRTAFLGEVCAAAWADWIHSPQGRQTEVGRMGFVGTVPNLLLAVLLTLVFFGAVSGALPTA